MHEMRLSALFICSFAWAIDKSDCVTGLIVNLRLTQLSWLHVPSSVIGFAETHTEGCVVGGDLYKWSDIASLSIDIPRSLCDKDNHIQFTFKPFNRFALFPLSRSMVLLDWLYKLFIDNGVEGIVVRRDFENGCEVNEQGINRFYPWWGITEAFRVTDGSGLRKDYCTILPCLAVRKLTADEILFFDNGHN